MSGRAPVKVRVPWRDHERPAWHHWGKCHGAASVFFTGHGEWKKVLLAKATCATCPVKVPCLEYALANFEAFGVWGGTSPEERKAIRRARREGAA